MVSSLTIRFVVVVVVYLGVRAQALGRFGL